MTREVKNVKFADWLRKKRKEMGISQQKLADMVNCHLTTLGRWEREEAYPSLDYAEDIIHRLGGELVIREQEHEGS